MMLLDTCVVSEIAKRKPNRRVRQWFDTAPEADLYLSVLTIGEIAKGCAKLGEGNRKRALEAWLGQLREEFSARIHPIDEQTAEIWGRVSGESARKGHTVPVIDGLIAASAIRWGLTVVTRNTHHFTLAGVRVLNPWG